MHAEDKGHPLDAIRYTRTRSIAVAPDVLRDHRIVTGLHNDPRADVFRVLRTNILRQLRDNHWNSLAVTSATPGAGKTFVAVNLALAMALEANQSVLLIDGDFRRPRIARYLGLETEFGLVDYLADKAALENILINPGFDRLTILPGRDSGFSASELVSSPRMSRLVEEMKSRYEARILIFDIPPLGVADDALLVMPYIDGIVLVIEDEKNTPEEVRGAIHVLEGTNLLGLVLNKSRMAPANHYYL